MTTIRVVAPSKSLAIISEDNFKHALHTLEKLGFKVEFSRHAFCLDLFESCSVQKRVSDLHEAYLDSNVDIILAGIGGFNSNQLLDHLDYHLISKHPKILCGYSDITVLLNAIYSKTSMITYLGPNFHSFAMKEGLEETIESFMQLIQGHTYIMHDPNLYSDDPWYDNQEDRNFLINTGKIAIRNGYCEGKIIAGNLCSLNLLQGTPYFPDISDSVLFLEDDNLAGSNFPYEFDRNIQSLIHQKNFNKVKGLVIGRCQESSGMSIEKWMKITQDKPELHAMPVIIGGNFGHTTPMSTLPIGGRCKVLAKEDKIEIKYWVEKKKENDDAKST